MSQKRLKAWQKATALVPLALLSGAWTASLAVTNTASAATEGGATLPDGTSIPTQAITAPASVSIPGEIAPGVPAGAADSVISSASTNGIPAVALAAYQRAAQVIDAADPSCNIGWPLIAAIGRVESDHGRYGGNTLSEDGESVPGIYGIPLDGSNGTAKITDTDAGQYDNDPVYDRAVGPMQFIPSTWSVVGVDGDGDGKRDPQDIDDASLATAVYLCSGNENLSTANGQQASVYRYNHSQDYVNLVMAIMRAYLAGDFAAVPNSAAAPMVFSPAFGDSVFTQSTTGKRAHTAKRGQQGSTGGSSTSAGGGTASTGGTSGATTPSVPGTGGGSTSDPVATTTDTADQAAKDLQALTQTATDYCKAQLADQGASDAQIQSCVNTYVTSGKDAADHLIANLLDLLGGVGGVGGLLGQ